MKKLSAAIYMLILLSIQVAHAQKALTVAVKPSKIDWISWEEAMEKSIVEKKKILLDVYTDWCYWCKRMDESTFQHPELAQYINEHFYAVKFNAEQKKEIEFNGNTYKFIKNGKRGYHELAAELLKGRLSFPTLVFLDENLEVIQSIVGYKTPPQLEQIVTYFADNYYKKTPWSTYKKTYKSILVSDP